MPEPDILYAVRPGERNEQLKLSLRSLANLPHRRVFIAGYCPGWVRDVVIVEVRRRANKFDAIEENVRQALQHPEMSDDVVYMNDDFYVTQPIESVPVTHGGTIDQYQGKQELKIRMRHTLRHLQEHAAATTLTYDGVHMPLPLERDRARAILLATPRACLWRTWYGNVAEIGGDLVPNAKARGPITGELPTFLSTGSKGYQVLRERLNDVLPERTPYVW